jgi:uncharacterized protein YbjQ (UPF0145 family)
MNKRDIMFVVAGLVGGYLLTIYLLKKIIAQGAMDSVEPMVNQAKIDKCNAEVALKLQTAKFGTPEAQEAFKKSVFDDCIKKA